MSIKTVGVMCGSSEYCPSQFLENAYSIGAALAKNKFNICYGGGAKGLMRRVADGGLDNHAKVIGVMPDFMIEVEWQHPGISELITTHTMEDRKTKMFELSDATIFLPGGSGTLEEFFDLFTAKRLAKYMGPLVVFNDSNYFDSLKVMLNDMVENGFLNQIHLEMVQFTDNIDELVSALVDPKKWNPEAIHFASVAPKDEQLELSSKFSKKIK